MTRQLMLKLVALGLGSAIVFVALTALLRATPSPAPPLDTQLVALPCDADSDGDIDNSDLLLIRGANGQQAATQTDSRDGNGDGRINVADVRFCQLRFLPPDPGEAGKQTLQGIDSDGDGVRDDVQRWIVINFADAPTQRALKAAAIATQRAILASDESTLKAAVDAEIASSKCLTYDLITAIDERVLNTSNRAERYDALKLNVKSAWINESRDRHSECTL